jgi:signal transduction histidine kinase
VADAVADDKMFEVLRTVPLFSELPEADLRALCKDAEGVDLSAGEDLFAEGDPGDKAYVVTEGKLEVVKASTGREVLLNVLGPGEVVGEMALLEDRPRMASVRARDDSKMVSIRKDQLDHLLKTSLGATRALFYSILGRWRATEGLLRQGEKMAQLGTLTAGVAHELNNPAAAVTRGADQIGDAITRYAEAQSALGWLALAEDQQAALRELAQQAQELALLPPEMDTLARSDREYELETWLEDHGVADAWEVAPPLANMNFGAREMDGIAERFEAGQLGTVVGAITATYAVHNLMAEIGQGAGRISEIVKALKSYSYLDQAPVQAVNVHEGLDNTLLILQSKLKGGISVKREYADNLPGIQAYGSELNQVWTNLIDNAADALEGHGEITLRTRHDNDWVVVDVEDNGPGIPSENQSRVFDAFFTTKPPGKGTGMGLDITYNIVVYKHRGDIVLTSEPGKTRFEVWLPVNFEAK